MTPRRLFCLLVVAMALVVPVEAASADAPAGSPCGFTASVPGGDGPNGYALEAGHTRMATDYVYRVVAGTESWVPGVLGQVLAQVNAATGANLTRGSDVQYQGDLSLMQPADHEIWVFTNTSATRGARPPGTWTFTQVADGRTTNGWISVGTGLPGSTRLKSLLHETGHSLGLDHYFWPYNEGCQVMSYGDPDLTAYRSGDINGLRALVGKPPRPGTVATPPPPADAAPTPHHPSTPTTPSTSPAAATPPPVQRPTRAAAVLEALAFLERQ